MQSWQIWRREFHRVLRRQTPDPVHRCKEEPCLGSVLSSGSRMAREPGCSLSVLPLGEHKGCPSVALSNILASFASGGCPDREQPGQLQVLPEHWAASGPHRSFLQQIPALPACSVASADCSSGGTVSPAGLARSRAKYLLLYLYLPKISIAKNKTSWAITWVAGLPA